MQESKYPASRPHGLREIHDSGAFCGGHGLVRSAMLSAAETRANPQANKAVWHGRDFQFSPGSVIHFGYSKQK